MQEEVELAAAEESEGLDGDKSKDRRQWSVRQWS